MRTAAATLAVLAILLTGSIPAAQKAEPEHATGAIRGAVTDGSGSVLPGVTVVVTGADGSVLATVTDGSGRYVLRNLPAGAATVGFNLEGFAEATASVVIQRGELSWLGQELRLASLSETVVVRAKSADVPHSRFASPPPEPPLVARPLPEHDRSAVCGPAKPDPFPESVGTIRGRRHEAAGDLFLAGDELMVNGGLEEGLLVGRNLVTRRHYHVRGSTGVNMLAEHSSGVVQIVTAADHSSLAVVIYSCDAIRNGDFLASFKPEQAPDPEPRGTPAYDDAARILFADDGQTLGVPERMMVIDRGAGKGVRIGQRFTLFRHTGGAVKYMPAGEAIVVSVKNDSATIRIERVTDAVAAGDWAAPQSARSAAVAVRQ